MINRLPVRVRLYKDPMQDHIKNGGLDLRKIAYKIKNNDPTNGGAGWR